MRRPARAPAAPRLRWRLARAGWRVVVLALHGDHVRRRLLAARARELRQQIDREISGDAASSPTLRSPAPHARASVGRAATRYVRDQPFSASSTLLFALVPGAPHGHQPPGALQPRRARQRRDRRRAGAARTALARGC